MSNASIDQLNAAWITHNSINLLLIKAIPVKAFSAVPLNSKGRTIAAQLEHMNRVRLGWIHYHRTGKHPATGTTKLKEVTRTSLVQAFTGSGTTVEQFFSDVAAGETRLRAFKANPLRFMAYLISHESHHRGSIMLALKQNGFRLPEKISQQGLWGTWMWGK